MTLLNRDLILTNTDATNTRSRSIILHKNYNPQKKNGLVLKCNNSVCVRAIVEYSRSHFKHTCLISYEEKRFFDNKISFRFIATSVV